MSKKDDKNDQETRPVSGQTSSEMNLEAQAKGLARPSGVNNLKDVEKGLDADAVKEKFSKELKNPVDNTEDPDITRDQKYATTKDPLDAPPPGGPSDTDKDEYVDKAVKEAKEGQAKARASEPK